MKSKFRKVNRGLILSLLVVLGIVAYYAVLGVQAAPEKKLMNETLTGFFEQYAPAHIVPDEYKTLDVTKDQVKTLSDQTAKKFSPYFADQKSLDFFMENEIDSILESQTLYPSQDVIKAVCDYKKILSADIDRKDDKATVKALVQISSQAEYYNVEYNEDGTIAKKTPSGGHSGGYSWETQCTFTMQKTDGKWLITGFSGHLL